jgi:ABC-type multidrug transport system ATPase subunit
MIMLRIEQVTKVFAAEDGRVIRALDNFSLQLNRESLTVLMGPNGSGKSTLFRVLAGQIKGDSGTLVWDDNGGDRASKTVHQPRVAHVPQEPRTLAFPEMTLSEHLLWAEMTGRSPRFWHRGITRRSRDKYRAFLEQYGAGILATNLSQPFQSLSVGWQQTFLVLLTAVGHTLTDNHSDPALLLLDEPTSSLDVKNAEMCLQVIRTLRRQGHTIVLATHEIDLALKIADRVCVMNEGKLVADLGAPEISSAGAEGLRHLVLEKVWYPSSTKAPQGLNIRLG